MSAHPSIHPYLAAVREQYETLQNEAQRWHVADPDKSYEVAIEYHTPAGEEIRVNNVCVHPHFGTLQIEGWDEDGSPCDVVAHPQSASLILRLRLLPPGDEPIPVGFTSSQNPRTS
ncbi:MAG: hypothetical protein JOZ19_14900 [Rubrobacter sp.]|nr:hypothetical protein [Rubrobacter sp.]